MAGSETGQQFLDILRYLIKHQEKFWAFLIYFFYLALDLVPHIWNDHNSKGLGLG